MRKGVKKVEQKTTFSTFKKSGAKDNLTTDLAQPF